MEIDSSKQGVTYISNYSAYLNSLNQQHKDFPAPIPLFNKYDQTQTSGNQILHTGTGLPFLRESPPYLQKSQQNQSISIPSQNLLQECLRREAQKIAYQELLLNKVVYDCIDLNNEAPQGASSNFPYYILSSPHDSTLIFQSRFQSGNLRRVNQIYQFEYDLILKPDYNTRGNTQWFYFSVKNTRAGQIYRFNIINMMKPDSLYNYGMMPCVYSQQASFLHNKGWFRSGFDICYYQNTIKKKSGGNYFTLTFALEFPYQNDTISIAHCYPYTYTDLNHYLSLLQADPKKKTRIRRKALCNTIAGNQCDYLVITSFSAGLEAIKKRKGVILTARVHPGQSNASWMMKGLIDYLTGPSLDAKILRDNFIFKIIPMLNPDGVINGSYRCGLAGVDLNRQWIQPSRRLHPTIFYAKQLIREFVYQQEIIIACDLHGHSRKKNIFMYGCVGKNKIREKIFPRLMEKSSQIFCFADCQFGLQKAKQSTARIVLYKEFGIINSYTIESSFAGPSIGPYADFHFSIKNLEAIGHDFCDALLDFCDPDQSRVREAIQELEQIFPGLAEQEEEEELAEEVGEQEPNGKKKPKKKRNAVRKKQGEKKKK